MTTATSHFPINLRTPGERAFDRSFLPFVALILIDLILRMTFERNPPPPAGESFAPLPPLLWPGATFVIGVLAAGFWLRATATLLRVWSDPSARILRFSAAVILLASAGLISRYLHAPF